MSVVAGDLDEVRDLYRRGLFVQAHKAMARSGEYPDWSDPEHVVMATRVASQLGGQRQAWAWTRRAFRRYPDHPLVRYYFTRSVLHRRGVWEAWQRWHQLDPLPDPSPPLAADWISFKGVLAALLRDFDVAEACLARALELAPRRPWTWCDRADVSEYADRCDEALAHYQTALALQPWYVPAVQGRAHLLAQLNRDDEAIELLTAAAERLESGGVVYQLATLYIELGRYCEARESLDRLDALLPCCDRNYAQAIAALRSDAAYYDGDQAAAIEHARRAGKGFFATLADNLTVATEDARRVQLKVGFVRQHWVTCAPATLTALARYWGKPAEHLEVAERICYDGTPSHSERKWAVQNGFVAREFTVDWDTAVALIDRGVPFTFTTVHVANSHLQAVIGYDMRRGTLLLRDPNQRRLSEILSEQGLAHYRANGPRGMTIVPQEEAARLDGMLLPDAELYDELHQLDWALVQHDRPCAQEAYERMRQMASEHRLTFFARRTLAHYDADLVSAQHAQQQWTRMYPDDGVMLYASWYYAKRLGTRQERLDFLAPLCGRQDLDPLFRLHYVEELIDDARSHDAARRELRRLVRQRSTEARVYRCLGSLAWADRRFDDALQFYRFAACLADKDEQHAWAYFCASRQTKSTPTALNWLESRHRRLGDLSADPARTLFMSFGALDRMDQAFQVLNDALQRRPDDGALLLFAADARARSGEFDKAAEHLAAAEARTHRGAWLRTAADIASYRGELEQSLELWQRTRELEPQAADAASAVARLLSQLEGEDAARRHLQELLDRFPHNVELLQHALSWFREADPDQYVERVRRLVEINPVDGWARRELSLACAECRRLDQAVEEAELAVVLEPTNTTSHAILGNVLERSGKFDRARDEYRRAVELSVDNDHAIHALIRLSPTQVDCREALKFVFAQLAAQTMYGDGLLAYVDRARGVLPGDEVLENLRQAHAARPDLWHCWSALVRELAELQDYAEAESVATRAVERFSLMPGAWVDLATVHRLRNDAAGEIDALEHALAINPVWSRPLRDLADAYQRQGDLCRCRDFLKQSLRRTPQDAILRGYLADVLWSLGERQAALDEAERSVRLDVDYGFGWHSLLRWGPEAGCATRAADVARDLTARRPTTARAWYWLGRVLTNESDREQRRAALYRALELDPQLVEGYVWLARAWTDEQQFDAALEACRLTPWGERRPAALRLEEARVEAARHEIAKAIELAVATAHDHAHDYDAWRLLATLTYENGVDKDRCLQASEEMIRLAPLEAVAWCQLGDARRWNEQIADTEVAYRRALELAPAYEYVSNCLFDLAMEANDLPKAGEVLSRAMSHEPTEFLLARGIIHAAKCCDRMRAVALFERLAEHTVSNDWPLQQAVDSFTEAGWASSARSILAERIRHTDATPQLGTLWAKLCAGDRDWRACTDKLDSLARRESEPGSPLGGAWYSAAVQLLNECAAANQHEVARRFVEAHKALLTQNAESWGTVGYVLCDHAPRLVTEFMGDWRQRDNVQPWMLVNLANAFSASGDERAVVEVHQAGLELPNNSVTRIHQIMLALYAVADGRWEQAEQLLQEVEPLESEVKNLDVYYLAALAAARSAIDVRRWWNERRAWYHTWLAAMRFYRGVRGHRKTFEQVSRLSHLQARAWKQLARERGLAARCIFALFNIH